jgi:hypothetical protein
VVQVSATLITVFHPQFVRKENYCLVQYIVDKYGDDPHNYAIGLKAGSYQNIFEWQNAVAETSADELDLEVPAFTNWVSSSPSGMGDCVFMAVKGVCTPFFA